MTLTHSETRSAETRLRSSQFQECNNVHSLAKLIIHRQSLRQDELESFDSDVAVSTGVIEITQDNLTKVSSLFPEIETKLAPENETGIQDDTEEELLQFRESMNRALIGPSISEEVEDLLDWEAHIESPPPPSRSGTIKVRFKYIGRSKPIPIEDPWA